MKWTSIFLAGMAAAVFVLPASARVMSVQVREGALRSGPSFLGQLTAKVTYAQQVQILGTRGDWVHVSAAGKIGWIHESALTTKKLKLQAGTQDARLAASTDELALAGKGFSAEVESEFQKENRQADYTLVNKIESIEIPDAKIRGFLVRGGVEPPKGGVR